MAEERGRYLPEELQDDILRRLPVKSLMRFESVCRTWQSKFHSRGFIDLYGRRPYTPESGGVVCIDDNPLGLHSIVKQTLRDMMPGVWDPLLLDSLTSKKSQRWSGRSELAGLTNGVYCLICLPIEEVSGGFSMPLIRIGLCNPATRNYKLADPFPPRIRSALSWKPPGKVQFGFGKIGSEEYKIVVIVQHDRSFICLVYGREQGKSSSEWRKVVDYKHGRMSNKNFGHTKSIEAFKGIKSIYNNFVVCSQKFLEGCWHWVFIGSDYGASRHVLSFNFADESFKVIGAPEAEPNLHAWPEVFVLDGRHLAFIYLLGKSLPGSRCIDQAHVWTMMEYGVEKSWTRIYRINSLGFNALLGRFLGMECDEEENGAIRIERLFFEDRYDSNRIISFDDAGHEVYGFWESSNRYHLDNLGISTYAETLEPL